MCGLLSIFSASGQLSSRGAREVFWTGLFAAMEKALTVKSGLSNYVAERTGLEPATPCVTGRYSNQLNYRSTDSFTLISNRLITVCSRYFPCQRKRNKFDAWQFPTLAWGGPTLPSALRRFTSEFGMGSGGTTALKPPGKFCLRAASDGHTVFIRHRLKIVSLKNASGVVRLSLTGH